ncbi:unnamed protein product, partial [Iphiclides podalirius]
MAFRCFHGPVDSALSASRLSGQRAKEMNIIIVVLLYEISDDPQRKEFLDDLFSFMQKRGKFPHIAHWVLIDSPHN